MREITSFLKKDNSSFIFLQEVDTNSTRSFRIDQYDYLKNSLKAYSSSMALNYKNALGTSTYIETTWDC